MNVVFRTDASSIIGSGHVIRCLTLAEALMKKGTSVLFVCREHQGHLCDLIEERGIGVKRLSSGPIHDTDPESDLPPHATWLGATWQEDARLTVDILSDIGEKPDWLVVDHYGIDYRWERVIRDYTAHLMVIDDLADRLHDCDLLLDQNLGDSKQKQYVDKLPAACKVLFGPEYALLQPVYKKLRNRVPQRRGSVQRVCIYFGAADDGNLTAKALSAFLRLERSDIAADVVLSANSQNAAEIHRLIKTRTNITLYRSLPTLSHLLARADLAIGASGTTSWERLCLGLPAIVVTLAENQRPIAHALDRHNFIRYLGDQNEVSESDIHQALAEIIDESVENRWPEDLKAVVDGSGTDRVCLALTSGDYHVLNIRNADLSDEAPLKRWIESPDENITGLLKRQLKRVDNFCNWFYDRMRRLDTSRLYIAETDEGTAAGAILFERDEITWEWDCVTPAYIHDPATSYALFKVGLHKLRKDTDGALSIKQKSDIGPECKEIGLCTDTGSWINSYIPELIADWLAAGHQVTWAHDAKLLSGGDHCFYLSYSSIVDRERLDSYKHNLVVHESDLPAGRGWSPLSWQVLEGVNSVCVTLLEAAEEVDSGVIYLQELIKLTGDELVDELRVLQADATLRLCKKFVTNHDLIVAEAREQKGKASYYPRRRPEDSELDPDKTLREQFNLLRISDNTRYPAWFKLNGVKYALKIVKQ